MSTWILCLAMFAAIEQGEASFTPTSAEGQVPELFRLAASPFRYEMEFRLETPAYTVSAVRFPSPIVSPDIDNNTVHAEYFQAKAPGKRPAVVVLHILGADFALSRYLAARLADRGVSALFIKLPYYGERRPKNSPKFLSHDVDRSVLAMRQGVCDIRYAAAWLGCRPEVDPSKLGVTGISLGGVFSALAASVDPTLNRTALLLAGGSLHNILWEMPEREAIEARTAWVKSGRSRAQFQELTTPFDPLTYASGLKGKRVMMVAGNVDEVIPPYSATMLWEAAGRPPITWYDCGHYSVAGFILPAIRETVAFFEVDNPKL